MDPLTLLAGRVQGVRALAYTMVAERDNQTVKKERSSALILLANARVWASEGWQVSITDADGKEFDPTLIENWLSPETSSPLQPLASSLPQDEPLQDEPLQDGPRQHEPRQHEPDQDDIRHERALAAESQYPTEGAHGNEDSRGNDGFHGHAASYDEQSYDEDTYEEDEAYADIDPENVRDDQDFSEADGNLIRATNP
jgi:hypothetical protein